VRKNIERKEQGFGQCGGGGGWVGEGRGKNKAPKWSGAVQGQGVSQEQVHCDQRYRREKWGTPKKKEWEPPPTEDGLKIKFKKKWVCSL